MAGGRVHVTTPTRRGARHVLKHCCDLQTTSKHYTGIYHALSTGELSWPLQGALADAFSTFYESLLVFLPAKRHRLYSCQSVGPTIAINFCVYETLYNYWNAQRPDSSRMVTSLISGGVALNSGVSDRFGKEKDATRGRSEMGIASSLRHIAGDGWEEFACSVAWRRQRFDAPHQHSLLRQRSPISRRSRWCRR
ncbi:uncharacterized protein LOC112347108 [Selaginella moellendorffii]|uniref:uncharacterized protein LOC112347108 n=1 Tax=Selaginella moellendorffii TaxID=88036 RepID=UPI000D1C8B4C|nr:uncharacterized protein LOC112347108 [Selaginella moellendorffii]|eukprot:XP_024533214.1 uncharacterized protein LOC112347108 [Selaginella moellendorffii]